MVLRLLGVDKRQQPALLDSDLTQTTFAAIDLETTGLYPGYHHRIVEIGVVRTDLSGNALSEYSTLVNPLRDIGASDIHGITASDVAGAPTFEEIAGDLLDELAGSVLVAHNAPFDLGFLAAEFERIGTSFPSVPAVCTLALSQRVDLAGMSRRLSACCQALGISHEGAHTAIGDARAVACLFSRMIARLRLSSLSELGCVGPPLPKGLYPELKRSGISYPRHAAKEAASESTAYLSRLVSKMPASAPVDDEEADAGAVVAYLDLLDRALDDRLLTKEEADGLMEVAATWGMSRKTINAAHATYLRDLARTALADGHVSAAERADLELVARWLGLDHAAVDEALDSARHESSSSVPAQAPESSLRGKSVCFTGQLTCTLRGEPITRDQAEALAAGAGLRVQPNVTRKLDFLVVADPLTQSTKARAARKYGVRILAETVFWQMIGVEVD